MNCITLTEPWASAVARGAKRIETRSWGAPKWAIGQPIAIHAAKGMTWGEVQSMNFDREFRAAMEFIGIPIPRFIGGRMADVMTDTRGKVLATAMLMGVVPITHDNQYDIITRFGGSEHERTLGVYHNFRFAWILADVIRLPDPVPAKGALGIWDWQPPDGAIEGTTPRTRAEIIERFNGRYDALQGQLSLFGGKR